MMSPSSIPNSTLERAAVLLAQARRVFVLTGAGVSAESGIRTFRDAQTGLWSRFDPMRIASQEGFAEDPGLVWRWYMERLGAMEQALPNPGHMALAELERSLPDVILATQNIDDLHERGGSESVLHLHGTISRFHCNRCEKEHRLLQPERSLPEPPRCAHCGDLVRPSVVWFGEMLPGAVLERCYRAAQSCDVMLVVGTSGIVYPVAALPEVAKAGRATLIDVNPEPNPISEIADVYLEGRGGEVLPLLAAEVSKVRAASGAAD